MQKLSKPCLQPTWAQISYLDYLAKFGVCNGLVFISRIPRASTVHGSFPRQINQRLHACFEPCRSVPLRHSDKIGCHGQSLAKLRTNLRSVTATSTAVVIKSNVSRRPNYCCTASKYDPLYSKMDSYRLSRPGYLAIGMEIEKESINYSWGKVMVHCAAQVVSAM